jgi:hypothetical protein
VPRVCPPTGERNSVGIVHIYIGDTNSPRRAGGGVEELVEEAVDGVQVSDSAVAAWAEAAGEGRV